MRISPVKSILGVLLTIIFFIACSLNKTGNSNAAAPNSNQTANTNGETAVQDDAENLAKIVKLPFTPEEATYIETDKNGKRLVAVLRFAPEDAAKIAAAAEKYQKPIAADIDAEAWFPPELVARTQETGDETLKGIEYAANDFLQPPYAKGKLTRINETDYFVLELTAN